MKTNIQLTLSAFPLFLTALAFASLSGCGNTASTAKNSISDSAAVSSTMTPAAPTVTDAPKQNWAYEQDSDKMTSKIKYYASVTANQELQLKAPYDGGVIATFTLRNMTGENEAMLQITKGQFLAGVTGQNIQVRFDSLPAETYECSGPADYSSTVLFINSPGRFVTKLKKAKKMLIHAELYDNGTQEMEFNVDGLNWKR